MTKIAEKARKVVSTFARVKCKSSTCRYRWPGELRDAVHELRDALNDIPEPVDADLAQHLGRVAARYACHERGCRVPDWCYLTKQQGKYVASFDAMRESKLWEESQRPPTTVKELWLRVSSPKPPDTYTADTAEIREWLGANGHDLTQFLFDQWCFSHKEVTRLALDWWFSKYGDVWLPSKDRRCERCGSDLTPQT